MGMPSAFQIGGYSESFYLAQNPDVAAAVKKGDFKSGFEQFILFGRAEGRVGIG